MQIVELNGSGYIWDPLSTYANPGVIQQQIADGITGNGWGLFGINVTTGLATYTSPLGYNYYNFDIKIINSDNSNPEIIRNAIQQIVNGALSGTQVNYVGSSNYNNDPTTGQINITPTINDQRPPAPSLLESIFGKSMSLGDVTNEGAKVLGLSVGTIALIAIGYVILTSSKRR